MKNVGNNSRGRSQGVPKIFRAPMYRAHCAVIFAIAQLSCSQLLIKAHISHNFPFPFSFKSYLLNVKNYLLAVNEK